jgi:hypothetical protein
MRRRHRNFWADSGLNPESNRGAFGPLHARVPWAAILAVVVLVRPVPVVG